MSALLAHIKAMRALGDACADQADHARDLGQDEGSRFCSFLALALNDAAESLERQARDEATGQLAMITPPRKKP